MYFGHMTSYSPALKNGAILHLPCPSVIPSFRDSVTAKLKCILCNNFYVCGPTSVKLILHLVCKVSKM